MDKSGYTLLPNRADNKCFGCGPANPHGLQMQFYTNGQTVASWITVPPPCAVGATWFTAGFSSRRSTRSWAAP